MAVKARCVPLSNAVQGTVMAVVVRLVSYGLGVQWQSRSVQVCRVLVCFAEIRNGSHGELC